MVTVIRQFLLVPSVSSLIYLFFYSVFKYCLPKNHSINHYLHIYFQGEPKELTPFSFPWTQPFPMLLRQMNEFKTNVIYAIRLLFCLEKKLCYKIVFENIPNERSQTQKAIYCIIWFICNIYDRQIHTDGKQKEKYKKDNGEKLLVLAFLHCDKTPEIKNL